MKNRDIAEIIFTVEGPRDHVSYRPVANHLISKATKDLMRLIEQSGLVRGVFEIRIRWYSDALCAQTEGEKDGHFHV